MNDLFFLYTPNIDGYKLIDASISDVVTAAARTWSDMIGYGCGTPHRHRRKVFLHHLVVGHPINGLQVDHINGYKWDNRASNLRVVTRAENNRNRGVRAGKLHGSKYKGVNWCKRFKTWKAAHRRDGVRYHIGNFKTQEAAAEAYNAFVTKLDAETTVATRLNNL